MSGNKVLGKTDVRAAKGNFSLFGGSDGVYVDEVAGQKASRESFHSWKIVKYLSVIRSDWKYLIRVDVT